MNKIICLWSCPRNVSTALMYSFAQRDDTDVFDEPLYAHYLSESGASHPGKENILKSQENNGDKVVQNIILQKTSQRIKFHKLMTHFLINLDISFLSEVINIIFIRNPKEVIFSYSKIIANPSIEDIGIKKQFELYQELYKKDDNLIVLDSKYLLENPELLLKKLCLLIDIPFNYSMLKWKKGGRDEDGVWADHWYRSVHNSTGFLPYMSKEIQLKGNNLEVYKESRAYYNFLTTKSIKYDTKV